MNQDEIRAHAKRLIEYHNDEYEFCLVYEDDEQAVEEFGHDCLYGSLEYNDNACLSMDDGGKICTLYLTEVDRNGLVK